MAAQDALERRPDPLDRGAAAGVAHVGADRHAVDRPAVERLPQEEQLGLGVDRRALRGRGEPRAADLDLDGQGDVPAAARAGRVRPPLEAQVAGAADERPVGDAALDERDHLAALLVGEQAGDVRGHALDGRWHGRPVVRRAVLVRRGDEPVDVLGTQLLELHVASAEGGAGQLHVASRSSQHDLAGASRVVPLEAPPGRVATVPGMQDRPTAAELLEAVADSLDGEVLPVVDFTVQHKVRVAANICRIVIRELQLGARGRSP